MMEGNQNNSFKFEPDKVEKSFKDSEGTSKVTIESDNAPLNMPDAFTLANRTKKMNMADIGPRSQGFAGVATLAGIIAVAGIIIAYLTLRY